MNDIRPPGRERHDRPASRDSTFLAKPGEPLIQAAPFTRAELLAMDSALSSIENEV